MKFADTSWWAAWVFACDRRHDEAVAMIGLLGSTEQVLTTNLVIRETWTLLRRRDGHETAVGFLDRVTRLRADRKLIVHAITGEQEDASWTSLRRHDERVYSFVDATSFDTMRTRRIREAFAFDGDFSAAGYIEVRP